MKLWLWLLNKLECKKDICILLVFKILNVLLSVIFALWIKKTIDDIYVSNNLFTINAIVFIFIIVLQLAISYIVYHLNYHLESSIENKLKSMMFTSILNKEYKDISKFYTGELMNRYTSDLSKISNALAKQIPNLITMFIRIIMVIGVISIISPLLSLILCIGGLIMICFAFVVKRVLNPLTKDMNTKDDLLKSHVQECLESLLVIHSFHCEESIYEMNKAKLNAYTDALLKKSYYMNIFETSLTAAIQCAYVTGFLFCVYGVMNKSLSVGTISAMISLITQIKTPFVGIGVTLPHLIVLNTHIDRIKDFINDCIVIGKPDSKSYYDDLEEIVLEHVDFSYGDNNVLNNFNLSVSKNETIAFVGYSGVGKTTVLKLIMNIYNADHGKIYLRLSNDCIDIADIGHGLMTYVPQDYGLMSGSIYETVAFGCSDINKDKVVYACKKACIHDDIVRLKDGYNTVLREHGKSMSGGQMQRLAIARAIYSDCPIMLLDEVTSSLHPSLEQDIISSLKSLDNKTIIIVTHRKEVLNICDRVIDFDEVV